MRRTAWALVVAAALTGCSGDDGPGTFFEYGKRTPPAVPSRTAPIDPTWVEAGGTIGTTIADGQYWGTIAGLDDGVDGRIVSLLLTQAFFAESCVEQFGQAECEDDYAVLDSPTGSFAAYVADLEEVSVVSADRQNFSVSAAEFDELLQGNVSPDSPATFRFDPGYPVLVTVVDGRATELNQIWVP
jgi:hypothetical protein